ncbi:MAG: universal stress protein [Muribaculaceae bacterium]|nr:universal stress protein [Muribaculaceae bacterium]
MGTTDDFFTLVVLSKPGADRLKQILEFHGVDVHLNDFSHAATDDVVNAVEVRIPLKSLEIGLKILESGQLASAPVSLMKMTGMGNSLLIPVDFSPASLTAVKLGFLIARKLNVEPIVLHAFVAPVFPSEPFGEDPDNPALPPLEEEVQESQALYDIDARKLAKFKQQILKAQQDGSVTDIHFSTCILEGIPEQVIQEYCKQNKPILVVMATRGVHKKEADLVGSVTAEVIDSCRVPIFTVPENCSFEDLSRFKRILYFCTFSAADAFNLRGLMRISDFPAAQVSLLPVSDRPFDNVKSRLEDLANFFNQTYPTASFHAAALSKGKFEDSLRDFLSNNKIDLIIVPNKKSSAFTRFFRPTLAHRILFDKDIPLLVLPV